MVSARLRTSTVASQRYLVGNQQYWQCGAIGELHLQLTQLVEHVCWVVVVCLTSFCSGANSLSDSVIAALVSHFSRPLLLHPSHPSPLIISPLSHLAVNLLLPMFFHRIKRFGPGDVIHHQGSKGVLVVHLWGRPHRHHQAAATEAKYAAPHTTHRRKTQLTRYTAPVRSWPAMSHSCNATRVLPCARWAKDKDELFDSCTYAKHGTPSNPKTTIPVLLEASKVKVDTYSGLVLSREGVVCIAVCASKYNGPSRVRCYLLLVHYMQLCWCVCKLRSPSVHTKRTA